MTSAPMPFTEIRPTVVMSDSSPLIHLAAVDQLDLLFRFGDVVVVDVVRLETCFDQSKPFAPEIARWIDANLGSRLSFGDTDLGPVYEHALKNGVSRPRNSGERAMVDWLAENIVHEGGPALIIYENGKIPNMLRREGLPEDVVVMTSRYLLRLSQELGYLPDAEQMWAQIEHLDTRSNPQAEATLIQRSM